MFRSSNTIIPSKERRPYLCNAPRKRADGALQVSIARHDCGDHGGAWSKYGMERTVTRVKRSRTASPIGRKTAKIRIEEGEEGRGRRKEKMKLKMKFSWTEGERWSAWGFRPPRS